MIACAENGGRSIIFTERQRNFRVFGWRTQLSLRKMPSHCARRPTNLATQCSRRRVAGGKNAKLTGYVGVEYGAQAPMQDCV